MNTRSSTNPTQVHPAQPSEIHGSAVLISLPGPQALLVHQLFNELLNGIREVKFETQVGMSEAELNSLFGEFDVWVGAQERDGNEVIVLWDEKGQPKETFERTYSSREIRSIRNMAEVVMLDLGVCDFQTRTGFYLIEAKRFLDELNALLLEPLHLDQQTSPLAH